MNSFERELELKFGKTYLAKLWNVKVGIAGAGGLGSNCASNLVRCGFKRFVIADFDIVELSNLNRQFYFYDQVGEKKVEALKANLFKINPDLEIETLQTLITGDNVREIFLECEVVVEAFDKALSKKMIVEAFMGSEKFVVSASGLTGIGRTDDIRSHRVKKNLVVVGDLVSDLCQSPPFSPRVNIAAAKQADAVLEYVLARDGRGSRK